MSALSPSSGNPSSAYPPTPGVACSKQNTRVRIVSDIALSGTRATIKIRGSSPARRLRRRSIQEEYGGIEYGGLPVNLTILLCAPTVLMMIRSLQCRRGHRSPAPLGRHVEGSLASLTSYLYDRTGGSIGTLRALRGDAAIAAILDGAEKVDRKLLDTVPTDEAAEEFRTRTTITPEASPAPLRRAE